MGLLAFPQMLKAGYDHAAVRGRDLRGRLARHPDPALDHADRLRRAGRASRWCKLYAAALLPGFLLAGLYIAYVIGLAVFKPARAPALPKEQGNVLGFGKVLVMLAKSFFPLAS